MSEEIKTNYTHSLDGFDLTAEEAEKVRHAINSEYPNVDIVRDDKTTTLNLRGYKEFKEI